jgi:hypothetical protein
MPKCIDSKHLRIPKFLWNSQFERYSLMRNHHHIHPKQHIIQHRQNKKNQNDCSSKSLHFSSCARSSTLKAITNDDSNLLRQLTQQNPHCLNQKNLPLTPTNHIIYLFENLPHSLNSLKTCGTPLVPT